MTEQDSRQQYKHALLNVRKARATWKSSNDGDKERDDALDNALTPFLYAAADETMYTDYLDASLARPLRVLHEDLRKFSNSKTSRRGIVYAFINGRGPLPNADRLMRRILDERSDNVPKRKQRAKFIDHWRKFESVLRTILDKDGMIFLEPLHDRFVELVPGTPPEQITPAPKTPPAPRSKRTREDDDGIESSNPFDFGQIREKRSRRA